MPLSEEEFNQIFEIFKVESVEHIEKLNSGLIALEEDPDQPGLIEEIFREAHSLKGAARMLDFSSIEGIGHSIETILGKIKKNELSISSEIISLILKALDKVTEIIDSIAGCEDVVEFSSLQEQLTQVAAGKPPSAKEEPSLDSAKHEDIEEPSPDSAKHDDKTEDFISERDINLFSQETEGAYQKLVNSLLNIEKSPQELKEIKNAYNQANALKGSARIMKHKEMSDVAYAIENALSIVINTKISVSSDFISTLLKGTDVIKTFIEEICSGKADIGADIQKTSTDYAELICNIQSFIDKPKKKPAPPAPKPSTSQSPAHQSKSTVRVSSDKLDRLMEQASELLTMKLRAQERMLDIQNIIDNCGAVSRMLKKGKQFRKISHPKLEKYGSTANCTAKQSRTFVFNFSEKISHMNEKLESLYNNFSDDHRELTIVIEKLQDEVRKTRLLPFNTIVNIFPRMVRDLSISENKEIKFKISGTEIELDKYILEEIKDPLMHMLRNCIDHGIEPPEERLKNGKSKEGNIHINLSYKGNNALIEVIDDGRGVDVERVKASAIKKGIYTEKDINEMKVKQALNLIFHPGFSTSEIITDISGRGIGMDVVKANIERLNGTIDFETKKDEGSKFMLIIPLSLSTTQALKISVCDEIFYLPVNMVEKIFMVAEKDMITVEGSPVVKYGDSFIPYVRLASVLEISEQEDENDYEERPVVILRVVKDLMAFGIDKFLGAEEVLMKGLGNFMKRVRNVSGVTIMRNGNIAVILNIPDLISSVQIKGLRSANRTIEGSDEKIQISILVVDDSVMTRTLEKNILESYGYMVTTAVDGHDALLKLQKGDFDVIVSDIQMPNIGGLELTKKIKNDDRLKKIPVILVTALESPQDKRKGIEVGADAYIVKSSFDQSNLLNTINRLV